MRLAWHIFKKDARRLWWAIAVTLALFATVASQDGGLRSFDTRAFPHSIAGLPALLLGNLLPLAWCYLVMLAVHQEPLVGDRQFWLTRPYSRRSLIAAKALFVVTFVHAPALVVDSTILLAHGFSSLAHAAPLLEKQALVAGLLVLPAAALAAVTRTMTHAFLASIALAYLGMTVYTLGRPIDYFFNPTDVVRYGAALLVLTAGCCLLLTLQSPYKISTALPVKLAEGGRLWNQQLGEPVNRPTYTAGSLLSPLYRRHTTFNVSEEVTSSAGSQWRVPPEALAQGRIVITPMHEAGCGIVTYELRDLAIGDYLVSRSVASAR